LRLRLANREVPERTNESRQADMANCHGMELGQVYVCEDCGLQLKVVSECEECGADTCGCTAPCTFECCGEPLKLKEED
jgi:hypothetical protein